MENTGEELHHKTSSGEDIYSTEGNMTPEERARFTEERQNLDHAYSLYLKGEGPNPYEKKDRDNVIVFPKPKPPEEEERKAA